MCLLAVHVRFRPDVPLLLAANREEFYSRPSRPPEIFRDEPPVLCGSDVLQGGTWLGVNAVSLVVGVTNRHGEQSSAPPGTPESRSRGLLCRDLLRCTSVVAAVDLAQQELASGRYQGANFFIADRDLAFVVQGGQRIDRIELSSGMHLLTNGDVDDAKDQRQELARQMFANAGYKSVDEFVDAARKICGHAPGQLQVAQESSIVIEGSDRGTVSSTVITLSDVPSERRYLFAPGPPHRTEYVEHSNKLSMLLERTIADQHCPPPLGADSS
ncbi:MAG: NRDE family protein [Pirellulales bacterium]|nr:NRDE family protein [Pirellulales bacterium]